MLRTLLAIALAFFVGLVAFYFYQSAHAQHPNATILSTTGDASRGRTAEATVPPRPGAPQTATRQMEPPPGPARDPEPLPDLPPADVSKLEPPPAQPDVTALRVGDPTPLIQRHLTPPVANIKAEAIQDTFYETRGGGERRHEATDILAPRGTPVVAVESGVIKKLFNSKPGGLTIYQYDSAERYCYYYAHLDRYADGIREGLLVKQGDVIGYVGITGNAHPNTPHLHFAILELGPEKKWWEDTTPINPYSVLTAALNHRNGVARKGP